MKLVKCVYFCAQKSIIKAGNNKFQDLINVPRTYLIHNFLFFMLSNKKLFLLKTNILTVFYEGVSVFMQ